MQLLLIIIIGLSGLFCISSLGRVDKYNVGVTDKKHTRHVRLRVRFLLILSIILTAGSLSFIIYGGF